MITKVALLGRHEGPWVPVSKPGFAVRIKPEGTPYSVEITDFFARIVVPETVPCEDLFAEILEE